MAQLHCYVPDELALRAQRRATQSGLSVSRYLAELVKRDAGADLAWPKGYFENLGARGARITRPHQAPLETRLKIK